MNSPKAIAYKQTDAPVTEPGLPHELGEEFEKEILAYNRKYNGYTMQGNLKTKIAFLGDEEDYINASLGNDEFIRNKYNLAPEIESFGNVDTFYNQVFEGNTMFGYVKKSDKLNLMPYGIYTFTVFDGYYPGFKPLSINLDEYIKFQDSEVDLLQKTVVEFYEKRAVYENNHSRHKGASLVYGAPGGGKSTAIMNLVNDARLKNKYVIFVPKHMSFKQLEGFKEAFDGHDVLIIMEEMTERLGNGTEDILNFLDGYSSWNNCYVIATTNYPEVLPPNLVDRPGRFNHLIEVKLPSDSQKSFYFKNKGYTDDEIAKVLPKTKGFSMDYVSQLVLQSKLHSLPLEECLTSLEENKKKVKNTFKGKSGISI